MKATAAAARRRQQQQQQQQQQPTSIRCVRICTKEIADAKNEHRNATQMKYIALGPAPT